MGVYSNIDLAQIQEIMQHYQLGEARSFEATVTGISNSNFKVTMCSGKDVLLKVSNDKTIEQLANEQTILQVLEKYDFAYSLHPFKTIQGKPIYQHNGFHGVVFPFINGRPPAISKDMCKQVGMALATLHSLEIHKEDLASIRPHTMVGHGGISIYEYTQQANAPQDFVDAFKQTFPDQLQEIPYDVFPVGIIHGDLYFDNSLFNNGQLVTLIDFEQSGRGRYILDLGIALSGTCLNDKGDNLEAEYIQCFLEGYESRRKLLAIEREYLHTAILVGFFSIGLWRIKRFYEGNLDESKRFNYRQLLSRAQHYQKELSSLTF
jgi:homoserine kinase type II